MKNDESARLLSKDETSSFAFVILGSGATVTYNAIVMAVAYFRLDGGLPPNALTQFARWHNVALVSVMVGLLGSPRTPQKPRDHVYFLVTAFGAACAVDVVLAIVAATRSSLKEAAIYSLVGLNGAATGVASSMGASLSSISEGYSMTKGLGVDHLRGLALGIAVPTAVQLLMLPLAGQMSIPAQTAVAAATTGIIAASICVAALIASLVLVNQSPAEDRATVPTCHQMSEYTIGKCTFESDDLRAFVYDRVVTVFPLACAQFVNMFCLVMMLLLTPRFPISDYGLGLSQKFWTAYLPTLCIAANNVFGYIGRSIPVGTKAPRWPFLYVLIAPSGLAIAHNYTTASWNNNNVAPIIFFAVVAVLVGRATVVFSHLAHTVCGHSHEFPCPIVAQINVLAVEAGALAGAFLT